MAATNGFTGSCSAVILHGLSGLTKAALELAMKPSFAGGVVLAITDPTQEVAAKLLKEFGFDRLAMYHNPGHRTNDPKADVKLWAYFQPKAVAVAEPVITSKNPKKGAAISWNGDPETAPRSNSARARISRTTKKPLPSKKRSTARARS